VGDGRLIGVESGRVVARMRDTTLYATILGVTAPWHVTEVRPAVDDNEIVILAESAGKARFMCPTCGKPSPRHDHPVTLQLTSVDWSFFKARSFDRNVKAIPRDDSLHKVLLPVRQLRGHYDALYEAAQVHADEVAGLTTGVEHRQAHFPLVLKAASFVVCNAPHIVPGNIIGVGQRR
jgi:hypothetical protein